MGKVYDLAKQEISEIENEVQKDLDKFSAGGIRFKIDITSEKTLELIFTRQYRDGEIDWLNYDSKTIYSSKLLRFLFSKKSEFRKDILGRSPCLGVI